MNWRPKTAYGIHRIERLDCHLVNFIYSNYILQIIPLKILSFLWQQVYGWEITRSLSHINRFVRNSLDSRTVCESSENKPPEGGTSAIAMWNSNNSILLSLPFVQQTLVFAKETLSDTASKNTTPHTQWELTALCQTREALLFFSFSRNKGEESGTQIYKIFGHYTFFR